MKQASYISQIAFDNDLPRESYLNRLPVIRYLARCGHLSLESNITFLIGENGSGKSTLLEAIAVAYGFNAEGGTKNFRFTTRATHSELWEHLKLIRRDYAADGFFLRAESLYNTASYIDRVDAGKSYGGRSLHEQSHGESFLAVVENRFRGHGLYLLDEPEAALSPGRLMELMVQLQRLLRAGSQFIIATHSPILMTFPGAQILELSETGIRSVDYRETEHYQLTRCFLENPERMLRHLLG